MIDRDKEISEIKEAICEIYESISAGSFTPSLTKIVEKFRNELEIETDMNKERGN